MYKMIITITLLMLLTALQCSPESSGPDDEMLCEITDTTSHAVTWRVDTIGIWPSALYDVAAIDENNVWAVGEVNTPEPDTVCGNDYTRNNAVKWNGNNYEYYQLEISLSECAIPELRVILAFSTENIWFFDGAGYYLHWNGNEWVSAYISEQKGSPTAAWGLSPQDFYIVGDNGSISHYDGNAFTLMESGTDKTLHDVSGYVDNKTGITHVWAAGELILLHYDGIQWQKVWDETNPLLPDGYNHPQALYVPNPNHIIIATYYPINIRGYCINTKDITEFTQLFSTPFWAADMRGLAINDIFITGAWNGVAHFNGSTVFVYPELDFSGNSESISYIPNNVYTVGHSASQFGYFIHGIKN